RTTASWNCHSCPSDTERSWFWKSDMWFGDKALLRAVQFLKGENNKLIRMLALLKALHNDESGQGLVEYLLIIAFVALAATVGMSQAASYINNAFVRLGRKTRWLP